MENLCTPAVGLKIPVFLANSFVFQCLSLSMHFSVLTTDVWIYMECSLLCMCAVDTQLSSVCTLIASELITVWCYHPLHHVALYGTSVRLCNGELLFLCMNTVPVYGLPFLNEVTNSTFARKNGCVHLNMYPHLKVTFTGTCHMFSNTYAPFPMLLPFWPE